MDLENENYLAVVKRAMNFRRLNKVQTAELVGRMASGEEVDLAQIYAYFLPVANQTKPGSRASWLKAVKLPAGAERRNLQYFFSDGKKMCATNGQILNYFEFSNDLFMPKEPGFYDDKFNRLKGKDDLKIQKVDHAIPKETVSETYHLSELEIYVFPADNVEKQYCYRIGEGYFEQKLLSLALRNRRSFKVLNADATWDKPIKIEGPWRDSFSVLMGMRKPGVDSPS